MCVCALVQCLRISIFETDTVQKYAASCRRAGRADFEWLACTKHHLLEGQCELPRLRLLALVAIVLAQQLAGSGGVHAHRDLQQPQQQQQLSGAGQ